MSAAIKSAIKRLLATVCFMWLFETRDNPEPWMTWFIYNEDVDWNAPQMHGKRVKIEFTVEDWNRPSFFGDMVAEPGRDERNP